MAKAKANVILAKDVINLGKVRDLVSVRLGYARNFLIPRGLAVVASKQNTKRYEHQQRLMEHKLRELRAESEKLRDKLAHVSLSIFAKSGPQGKLFGSVGVRDIEKELKNRGYVVSHHDIKLESAIKAVGNYKIALRLEADVMAELSLAVLAVVEEEGAVTTELKDSSAEVSADDSMDEKVA